MNIYEKLNKIQTELKAPKGQMNKFGNYRYRSCEDILEAVKPLLSETKTVLTIYDEIVQVGERIYVQAIATLSDCEEEKMIQNMAYAREEESKKGMDGSQVTGAASSYARKYALNGLFAIDDTRDSDATNTHGKEGTAPEETEEDIENMAVDKINILAMQAEMARTGIKEKQILLTWKVDKIDKLTKGQFVEVMKLFEKQPTKKQTDLGL